MRAPMIALRLRLFLILLLCPPAGLAGAEVDPVAVAAAARESRSVRLDAAERVRVVETFRDLVAIRGGSGEEQAVREAVRRRVQALGGRELELKVVGSNAPVNLAMELEATGAGRGRPGILLNAHLDTLVISTPERMVFQEGEFRHADESDPGAASTFGGDDRSGVAVLLEAVAAAQKSGWTPAGARPRVVLLFTGSEEVGLKGARWLARTQPELFRGLAISLTVDGPLDLQTGYPAERLVAVVSDADATQEPYRPVLAVLEAHAGRAGVGWKRTQVGLGAGDFAAFPVEARAGLHFRSPVRGWHRRERVHVQDLIHHVDLLATVLVEWEKFVPSGN